MRTRFASICLVLVAACGSTTSNHSTLSAEVMQGPATGPSGRVLVMTATCGSLEEECRDTWAPTVDQIVLSGLEFRGFDTINPETLHKDERQRDETIVTSSERVEQDSSSSSNEVGIIGIIPIASAGGSSSASVTVRSSRTKTVILQGANYDDLRVEDKRQVLKLAGANSVITTRVVVGANYSAWTTNQSVEVLVKLASAEDGAMRWSTRCSASSSDFATVEGAIENAAKCAASAFAMNQ